MTEPQYIRGLERQLRNTTVEVVIPRQHGVPRTLVDAAVALKAKADRDARRLKDDFIAFDEVWCVYDVDAHPKLSEALDKAKANGVELAISNPCFELWLLLHFRDSPGARDRQDVQRLVGSFIGGYQKRVDFDQLAPGLDSARARARRLHEDAERMGESGRNPTTGVFRLVDSMARVE